MAKTDLQMLTAGNLITTEEQKYAVSGTIIISEFCGSEETDWAAIREAEKADAALDEHGILPSELGLEASDHISDEDIDCSSDELSADTGDETSDYVCGTGILKWPYPTLDADERRACLDEAQDLVDEEGWLDEIESRRNDFRQATRTNRWWLAQLPFTNISSKERLVEEGLRPIACIGAWWEVLHQEWSQHDAKCYCRPFHGH